MKKIFTYPDNASDHYIDPDYVGDDTVGFQKRVKELVDGDYKPWEGTTPSGTVDEIMADMSKFNNASWLENEGGNNSMLDFWRHAWPQASMELIESDISSATAVDQTTSNIEFSSDHGLYNKQKVKLSDFNNSWDTLNNRELYVKKIDADTIQLATDYNLTRLIEFYDLQDASVSSATATDPAVFNATAHDVEDGTLVEMSNFDGSFAIYNGLQFYVQETTTNAFKVSWDAAGDNLLSFPQSVNDVDIDNIVLHQDGKITVNVDSAADNIPTGSQVNFDPNDGTTHSPVGSGEGLSTELDDQANLYVDKTDTDQFQLYYNTDVTDAVNWKTDLDPNKFVKDTTISFERNGDVYSFLYTISGTTGNHTGEIMTNHQMITGAELPGIGKTDTLFINRDSGSNYNVFYDSTFNERVNLGTNVVNAKKALVTTDDLKVHIPNVYSDSGNILDNTQIILDDATVPNLNTLSLTLAQQSWTVSRRSGGLNTGSDVIANILSVSDDEYQGYPILDNSGTAETTVAYDTSSLTHYQSRVINNASGSGMRTLTFDYNGNRTDPSWDRMTQASADLFFEMYDLWYEANTVGSPERFFNTPFVVNNLFLAVSGQPGEDAIVSSGYSSGYTNNTVYMIVTGFRQFAPSNGYFVFYVFDALSDGTIGGNLNIDPSGLSVVGHIFDNAGHEAINTYLENYYNHDRPGDETETVIYTRRYANKPVGFIDNFGTRIQCESSLRTGDIIYVQESDQNYIEGMALEDHTFRPGQYFIVNNFFRNTADETGTNLGAFALWPVKKIDLNLNFSLDNVTIDNFDDTSGDGVKHVFLSSGGTTLSEDLIGFGQRVIKVTTKYKSDLVKRGSEWNIVDVDANNYAYMTDKLDSVITAGKVWTNTTGTEYTDVTTFDVGYSYTDATQGNYAEVFTPATDNIIPRAVLTGATSGTLTISESESSRYRVASVDINMYGNRTYMQRTGDATYVNNAQLDDQTYQVAGYPGPTASYKHWPDTTVSTDSNGRVSGFSFDTEFPGAFPQQEDILFKVENVPDTYTPPAQSIASQQDNWDLDDAWTDSSYVGGSGKKQWPTHVSPSSAQITLNSPTIVNKSQNGIKYARKSGFTKWLLDVEYPPMTKEEFQIFHGVAQAAQGQAIPFIFQLKNKDGNNILWKDWSQNTDGTLYPIFKEDMNAGDTTALFEGFASDANKAFTRGEVISLDGGNDNGDLHTVLTDVDANAYGEAKIRVTYPVKGSNNKGDSAYKKPAGCVVTLASNDFNYTTDANGYYLVSVSFELDNYK